MNQPEFAGNGKLADARTESMLHHYAVMLFDDFQNDAKVTHIENRLRDLVRNYDDKVKWGKHDGIIFQPQTAGGEEVSGGNYPRVTLLKDGDTFSGKATTIRYEGDGRITVLEDKEKE